MNAVGRLKDWFRRLENGGRMVPGDACFLMVQARHLIEVSDRPDDYRTTAFYADWTVHSSIDRSVVCFEVLREITRVLAANFSPTGPDVTTQVSREIGLPRLRAELIALFRAHDLPLAIFVYRENWKAFVEYLLWSIAGQTIAFPSSPKGRAAIVYNEMLALPRPRDLRVEALALATHDEKYHWTLAVRTTDKQLAIVGQLEIAEGPGAFAEPPAVGA